jgi:uncharacterized protein
VEIIRNIILPEFKAGSYYNGLDKGTDVLMFLKEIQRRKKTKEKKISSFTIIIVIILALFQNKRRW